MLTAEQIEQAISPSLPAEHRAQAPALARLLAALAAGVRSAEGARAEVAENPALAQALGALGGRQVTSDGAVLRFGEGSQLGDVSVRDVAGGNIVNLSLPAQIPQRQQIDEKRTYGCLGLPILSITSSRTIITLALTIFFSGAFLGGLLTQGLNAPIAVVPTPVVSTAVAGADATEIAATVGVAVAQTMAAQATLDAAPATPSPDRLMLRVRLLGYNDAPGCISVSVKGVGTAGWRLNIDGLDLSAAFDSAGSARVCGLGDGQEVTISIVDGDGQHIQGGSGIPVRGGATLLGEWR
jgi:hypothetical protein